MMDSEQEPVWLVPIEGRADCKHYRGFVGILLRNGKQYGVMRCAWHEYQNAGCGAKSTIGGILTDRCQGCKYYETNDADEDDEDLDKITLVCGPTYNKPMWEEETDESGADLVKCSSCGLPYPLLFVTTHYRIMCPYCGNGHTSCWRTNVWKAIGDWKELNKKKDESCQMNMATQEVDRLALQ